MNYALYFISMFFYSNDDFDHSRFSDVGLICVKKKNVHLFVLVN